MSNSMTVVLYTYLFYTFSSGFSTPLSPTKGFRISSPIPWPKFLSDLWWTVWHTIMQRHTYEQRTHQGHNTELNHFAKDIFRGSHLKLHCVFRNAQTDNNFLEYSNEIFFKAWTHYLYSCRLSRSPPGLACLESEKEPLASLESVSLFLACSVPRSLTWSGVAICSNVLSERKSTSDL